MAKGEIILKTDRGSSENSGLIRVTPEAEKVLQTLRNATGLSKRRIASELIVQAAALVRIVDDDD